MDISDPYPYSQNGIELTHWNVFQALLYLAKFEYLPTYPHVHPLPPKIDELKKTLEDPTNQELACSFVHDGICYFKPWDAASVALLRWSCAEDEGIADRLNRYARWPRIEIDILFNKSSWNLRESLRIIGSSSCLSRRIEMNKMRNPFGRTKLAARCLAPFNEGITHEGTGAQMPVFVQRLCLG